MARNLADFELSGPSYMVWVIPITDPSEYDFESQPYGALFGQCRDHFLPDCWRSCSRLLGLRNTNLAAVEYGNCALNLRLLRLAFI
jgi:hypothetical protein